MARLSGSWVHSGILFPLSWLLVSMPLALGCRSEPSGPDKVVLDAAEIAGASERPEDDGDIDVTASVPVAPTTECPSDMRLVEGNYCRAVQHLCLKGTRKVKTDRVAMLDGQEVPVYDTVEFACPGGCALGDTDICTDFLPGHAPCVSTRQVKLPGGKTKTVPDEKPLRFCMDAFEYPNRVGEMPRVMVSWFEAEEICERQDKRLCDDDEWTLACEGPERLPYSYGWSRDSAKCNIDHRWIQWDSPKLFSKDPLVAAEELARLSQREPIGQRLTCTSPFGIYDLCGNVDEWARNVTSHGKPYVSLFKGGHWVGGARNRCRPATYIHGPEFVFYAEGFRCCSTARTVR